MSDFELMHPPSSSEDSNSKDTNEKLTDLYKNINVRLGGSSIRVELTESDYSVSFKTAMKTYRMMSGNSVYKTFGFLLTKKFVQTYILNEAVDNVSNIYRTRGFFATGSGFDPFNAATANLILRNARPESGFMGIATYDFYLQYEETLGRVFAREIPFMYRPDNNSVVLLQMPKGDEQIVLECFVIKTINELLKDHFAQLWLENYTMAQCKLILGRKYSKFPTLPGAQGSTQLDGPQLIEQGTQEIKDLEADILLNKDSNTTLLPIMG